jgi:TRAP-type C4-dicarboxylate transport system substrate-binding protein
LKLYSAAYEIEAEMLAFQVQERTEHRYKIEQIIGFDRLTAALGEERAAGGEQVLLEGAHKGELDLTTIASVSATEHYPMMRILDVPFMFRDLPTPGPRSTDRSAETYWPQSSPVGRSHSPGARTALGI